MVQAHYGLWQGPCDHFVAAASLFHWMTHACLHIRGSYKGPLLEQLEVELANYCKHLTDIHNVVFQQVKNAI